MYLRTIGVVWKLKGRGWQRMDIPNVIWWDWFGCVYVFLVMINTPVYWEQNPMPVLHYWWGNGGLKGLSHLSKPVSPPTPHHNVPLEWYNISHVGYVWLVEVIHSILEWFGCPWNCLVRVWLKEDNSILGSRIGGRRSVLVFSHNMVVIKWYSEEKEILNFIIKEGELGQLAERWVKGMDLFSPNSSSMWRCPYFESQTLNAMGFSPVMVKMRWMRTPRTGNFIYLYDLQSHAVLPSLPLAVNALRMKILSSLWASLFSLRIGPQEAVIMVGEE